MKVPSFMQVMISAIIVFACAAHIAVAQILGLCSPDHNPEYATVAMADMASMVDLVPTYGYSQLISRSYNFHGQDYPYWGHGACKEYVSPKICHDCLAELLGIINTCNGSMGGQATASSCTLRFEKYDFDLNW